MTSAGIRSSRSAGARSGADGDRDELAQRALRKEAAVDRPRRAAPRVVLIERQSLSVDEPAHGDRVVDTLPRVAPGGLTRARSTSSAGLHDSRSAHRRHDRGKAQYPIGVIDRDQLRDHPAHRDTNDVGGADPEHVEKAGGVVSHVIERVAAIALPAKRRAGRGRRARPTSSRARHRGCRNGSPGNHGRREPGTCASSHSIIWYARPMTRRRGAPEVAEGLVLEFQLVDRGRAALPECRMGGAYTPAGCSHHHRPPRRRQRRTCTAALGPRAARELDAADTRPPRGVGGSGPAAVAARWRWSPSRWPSSCSCTSSPAARCVNSPPSRGVDRAGQLRLDGHSHDGDPPDRRSARPHRRRGLLPGGAALQRVGHRHHDPAQAASGDTWTFSRSGLAGAERDDHLHQRPAPAPTSGSSSATEPPSAPVRSCGAPAGRGR